jgi:hypothetical protein
MIKGCVRVWLSYSRTRTHCAALRAAERHERLEKIRLEGYDVPDDQVERAAHAAKLRQQVESAAAWIRDFQAGKIDQY